MIFKNPANKHLSLFIKKIFKLTKMTETQYLKLCNLQLETLCATLEQMEEHKDIEVKLVDGVLTVDCNQGVFVINRQIPNQQIWYSSPVSGPSRFNYIDHKWQNIHHQELDNCLFSEIDQFLSNHQN